MLGFNGGLLGRQSFQAVRRLSGVWFPNEQAAFLSTFVVIGEILYSQSSVYSGTTAASNANMTNGSISDTATATNNGATEWVQMDLGRVLQISTVVVGTATNSIPGGWGKSYTENRNVQYSIDGSSWTTAFNTGTFASNGIYKFNVSFAARYIRLTAAGYLAISEFYALGVGQPDP